jgi:hypothetical protein
MRMFSLADPVTPLAGNGSCGYSNYLPYLEYRNLGPGTYFIMAYDPGWAQDTKYGSYTLVCSLSTATWPADSEPNNTMTQALALAVNDSVTGQLGYLSGDVADTIAFDNTKRDNIDWYKITLPDTGTLSITVESDPTLCVQMNLRSAADTTTVLKDNGGCGYSNYSSTLTYTAVSPGIYYLAAFDPSWNYNTKFGSYRLKITGPVTPQAVIPRIAGAPATYAFNAAMNGSGLTIHYQLPRPGTVRVHAYTASGRMLVLVDEDRAAGYYSQCIPRSSLASGVLLLTFKSGSYESRKVLMHVR